MCHVHADCSEWKFPNQKRGLWGVINMPCFHAVEWECAKTKILTLLYYSNKTMNFQLLFGQQEKGTRAFCLKWEIMNPLGVEKKFSIPVKPEGFCSKLLSATLLQIHRLGSHFFNLSHIYFLSLVWKCFLHYVLCAWGGSACISWQAYEGQSITSDHWLSSSTWEGLNSGCQAWRQVPLPTEPSPYPLSLFS